MHNICPAASLPVRLLSFALSYTLLVALIAPFNVRIVHAAGAAGAPRTTTKASSPPAARRSRAQALSQSHWRDGELLIRFRLDATEQAITAVLKAKGLQRGKQLRGESQVEKLSVAAGQDLEYLAADLRTNTVVEFVEPNFLISGDTAAIVAPNDPRFGEQWALANTGQTGGQAGADIGASAFWENTIGAPSTVIAVIDSGIDFTHPDLQQNQWTNTSEIANGRDDDGNGLVDDLHGWDWVAEAAAIKDEQ